MIQQVDANLWVGDGIGFNMLASNKQFKNDWSFVGAAKYPYHKQHAKYDGAEEEGYTGKALPKEAKEYLYAEREHALYLNLIDVDDPKYIPAKIISTANDFTRNELKLGRKVLICCNKGESRSPSLALMCMIENGKFDGMEFDKAINLFKAIYPDYKPKNGMLEWVKTVWRVHYNEQT